MYNLHRIFQIARFKRWQIKKLVKQYVNIALVRLNIKYDSIEILIKCNVITYSLLFFLLNVCYLPI